MKNILRSVIIAISLLVSSAYTYSQSTAEFEKGASFYTDGNYKEALNTWLSIYNSGHHSANLDYNIGNAYFKLGDIPNSILFFERAYLLDPADENINYNLQIARSMTVDKFQEIPELFFIKWFNLISLSIGSNTWAIISISSFLLCLAFLSLFIYSSVYSRKVAGFWLAIAFFIFSVSAIFFSWQNRTLVHDSHKAIITVPQINGKSSPDVSGTDLFIIHEGTKVTTGEKVGEWIEITLSDGNKGWIPAGSLNII
ncbi:MAG TPA: hypothetical protein VK213_00675 [Bacteroidales bacterium]|nr:hypothetical protein [Bacteroidales bacterium]